MEIGYIIGVIVVLYLILQILPLPFYFLYNGIVGAIFLWILNIFGPLVGIALPITIVNALIAGIFGVPGILFLLIWHYIL